MEAIRFCKKIDSTEYFKLPDYVEECNRCEWYYCKPEADAVIAKLQAALDERREETKKDRETIAANVAEIARLEAEISAAEKLCKIYFDIASGLIGEKNVRWQRDKAIAAAEIIQGA